MGTKGNAVGPGERIGGKGNRLENGVEGNVTDAIRIYLSLVLGEIGLEVGGPVLTKVLSTPNLRVIIGDDSTGDIRVGRGNASRIVAKSYDLGARGRKCQLKFFEDVKFFGGRVGSQTQRILV